MKIEDAYLSFLQKVNQNLDSNNITASKDRFVLIYNEEQIRRIEYILSKKGDDSIREIQLFLTSKTIPVNNIQGNKVSLTLPDDYLDLSSSFCTVSTSSCKNIRLSLFEIKDFDTEQIVTDENNKPSLRYREAPYYIGGDSMQVFTDNFTLANANLTYYRYPKKVDISGYIKADNTASTNIDPEGDDSFVNKVIAMSAESYFRNNQDPQGFQLNKDRIINNH